jgi:hypothetical protein
VDGIQRATVTAGRVERSSEDEEMSFEDMIEPHMTLVCSPEFAPIAARGDIVVLVHEPNPGWRTKLAEFGWKSEPVFAMSSDFRAWLLASGDPVIRPWLNRPVKPGDDSKVLAIGAFGSLYLNFNPRAGTMSAETRRRSAS